MRFYRFLLFALVCLVSAISDVSAATFTVTTTANEGPGSLRQAILDANANEGPDDIAFAIGGTGPFTIAPLTPLPSITDPVTLDGYSQMGSKPNQLAEGSDAVILIEIDGSNNIATSGLVIKADNTTIRGLAIFGFAAGEGILVSKVRNTIIVGNYIGTDATGANAASNLIGISGVLATGTQIGFIDPVNRNLISGNLLAQIQLEASSGSTIANNIIGPDRSLSKRLFAMAYLPNSHSLMSSRPISGISWSNAGDITIGGPDPELANAIGGNITGISLFRIRSGAILGNRVGIGPGLSNGIGIKVKTCLSIHIGNGSTNAGNTIAYNAFGIEVEDSAEWISILENSIHSNSGLGIDLIEGIPSYGVTENDTLNGDPDTGPNRLQNFPSLTSASNPNGSLASISGSLKSEPKKRYLIELFGNNTPDPSGHGEGQVFLSSFYVETDGIGTASFDHTVSAENGLWISSTATESDLDPKVRTGHTSEFSEVIPIVGSKLPVTNTDPDGEGSLRWAIEQANAADTTHGYVEIVFELEGDGPFVFPVDETLMLENDNVIIDGYSQEGSLDNQSRTDFDADIQIQLDGSGSSAQTGLRIEGSGCGVKGLSFVGFDGAAITINGAQNIISGSSFGVDVTDDSPNSNGSAIEVLGGQDNVIGGGSPSGRNYIAHCQSTGILLSGETTMNTQAIGNLIEEIQGYGIGIESAYSNSIGSVGYDIPSIIRNYSGTGVRDESELGNWIRNIHWGNLDLIIDTGPEGETPNDEPDLDGFSNIPQINSATISSDGREIMLSGRYASPPEEGFVLNIDVYLTDSNSGRWVGSATFPLDDDGETEFNTIAFAPFERVGLGANLSFTAALRSPAMPLGTSEVGGAVVALTQQFIQTEITGLSLENDTTQVGFSTNYGGSYDLQRSNSLEPQSWQNVATDVEGTGDEVTVEDALPNPGAFYRVAETRPELPIDYSTLETVALSGQSADGGSSGTYESFQTPTINSAGAIAFVAKTDLRNIEFATDFTVPVVIQELFVREPAGTVNARLLSTNTTNVTGEFVTFEDAYLEETAPFAISDSGAVTGVGRFFSAGITAQNVRFVASEGGLRKFDAEGTVVADGDPDELIWDNAGNFTLPVLIDDAGNALYNAVFRLDGTLNSSGSGIRYFSESDNDGVAETVVRDGSTIPSIGDTYTAVSSPVINASGDILFIGRYGTPGPNDHRALISHINGTDTLVLDDDDPAPGFPGVDVTLPTPSVGGLQLNDNQTYAFGAALNDNTDPPFSKFLRCIYVGPVGGDLTLVVAQEQATTLFDSPGSVISSVSLPRLSDSGLIAFTATYGADLNTVAGKGLFVYDNADGSTRRIYMTGDSAGEQLAFGPVGNFLTTNDVQVSNDHNTFAINDSGELGFLAEVGNQNEKALFYADATGAVTLIAKVGEAFELPDNQGTPTVSDIHFQGGSNSSGQPVGFNDSGQVAFGLSFSGGETASGLFLYNPPSLTE